MKSGPRSLSKVYRDNKKAAANDDLDPGAGDD
jgi:hypothetical protein